MNNRGVECSTAMELKLLLFFFPPLAAFCFSGSKLSTCPFPSREPHTATASPLDSYSVAWCGLGTALST